MPSPDRILYVSWSPPVPTDAGTRQRSNLLMRALRTIGPVDSILCAAEHMKPQHIDAVREQFGEVDVVTGVQAGEAPGWRALRSLSPGKVDALARHVGGIGTLFRDHRRIVELVERRIATGNYRLVVGRYLQSALQAGLARFTPNLLDMDDWDPQLYRAEADAPHVHGLRRFLMKRRSKQLDAIVARMLPKFDHVFMASPGDVPLAEAVARSVSVLPNIPFDPDGQTLRPLPANPASKVVLMVGTMAHMVNATSAIRFAQDVWPRIRERVPDAVFRVVGSAMHDGIRSRLVGPGVEPVGFVEKLEDAYRDCAFTIVPLFEGGGTKIKLLESLAFARTVVTTPDGLRGYESQLKDNESIRIAKDDAGLVDRCVELLNDPATRARLGEHGAGVVRDAFSFDRFRRIVNETVSRICAKGHPVKVRGEQ
ncbi:MAG: glycosyltransferase family 4 protein [Tepidisphaeraceae bacterium]